MTDIVFRADPMTSNGFGAFSLSLNAFVVTCEECEGICGKGATLAEADDDAFDNDAHYDGGDEGSGNTYCDACYTRLMDEAMRDAMAYMPVYAAEQALRDRQAREDDYLAMADLAFDAARERGEI